MLVRLKHLNPLRENQSLEPKAYNKNLLGRSIRSLDREIDFNKSYMLIQFKQ